MLKIDLFNPIEFERAVLTFPPSASGFLDAANCIIMGLYSQLANTEKPWPIQAPVSASTELGFT